MQIILRKEFDSLGKAGDVVTVKAGYARNYLIPRGIGYAVTKSNLARLENEKKILQLRDLKDRRQAGDLHAKLHGMQLTIPVQVGEENRVFGSVTSGDIAEAIRQKGVEVDRRKIELEEPIKRLGEFESPIKVHREVAVTVKLEVIPAA